MFGTLQLQQFKNYAMLVMKIKSHLSVGHKVETT